MYFACPAHRHASIPPFDLVWLLLAIHTALLLSSVSSSYLLVDIVYRSTMSLRKHILLINKKANVLLEHLECSMDEIRRERRKLRENVERLNEVLQWSEEALLYDDKEVRQNSEQIKEMMTRLNQQYSENIDEGRDEKMPALDELKNDATSPSDASPTKTRSTRDALRRQKEEDSNKESDHNHKSSSGASASIRALPTAPASLKKEGVKKKRGRPPKKPTPARKQSLVTEDYKKVSIEIEGESMVVDASVATDLMSKKKKGRSSPDIQFVSGFTWADSSHMEKKVRNESLLTDSDGSVSESRAGRPKEIIVPKTRLGKNLEFDDFEQYLCTLSSAELGKLNEEAGLMRADPTRGTDDWKVLLHLNMDESKDNLYFVSYKLDDMDEETIQLVRAKPYSSWNSIQLEQAVNLRNGEWLCVCLQPYYEDHKLPTEASKWRYQVHQKIGDKFSKGFYSFRMPDYVPPEDDVAEWQEPVSLLKSNAFVYGPFSWKTCLGTQPKEFTITARDWQQSLPIILSKQTKQGTLFWKGFNDDILLSVGCKPEEIEGNKVHGKFKNNMRVIPVLYNDRDSVWKAKIARCTNKPGKVRPNLTPYCWEKPHDLPIAGKKRKKCAGWIEQVSRG